MAKTNNIHAPPMRRRRPGDILFAVGFFTLSLCLLAMLPRQTTWVDRTPFFAQPSFWPALSIGAMCLFSGLNLLTSFRVAHISTAPQAREQASDRARKQASEQVNARGRVDELIFWVRSLEFAAWFLGYVVVVSAAGYPAATIGFCTVLALRLGYRGRALWAAAVFALAVVLVFKTALAVNLPSGAVYDALVRGVRGLWMIGSDLIDPLWTGSWLPGPWLTGPRLIEL